jgi:hypothetical protein
MEDKKINWFEIDLAAFQEQYDLYVAAVRACDEAERQMEACEGGTCTHERPLRKDGKPDRRYPCPVGIKSYMSYVHASNDLNMQYHADFWEAIGLGVRANA